MKRPVSVSLLLLPGLLLLLLASRALAAMDPDKAVAVMRNIKPGALSEEQRKEKTKELSEAWQALKTAGPEGVAALKKELQKMEANKEKDDHFKLGAAALLWEIGKIAEAGTVGSVWSGDVDLSTNYQYVFFPALQAAATQDPRVLPMLTAVLKERKGSVMTGPSRDFRLIWPLTDLFIWGAFGSKGVTSLEGILKDATDDTTRASAVVLLASDQDLNALPAIRSLARESADYTRLFAIRALGVFGHPDDFAFLLEGMKGKTPDDVVPFAYALYEYGDLRAVPSLIPLVRWEDRLAGMEGVAGLTRLPTPEGIEALKECADKGVDKGRRDICGKGLESILAPLGMTYEQYSKKTAAEKTALTEALIKTREERFVLAPRDRKLGRDEMLKALDEWKRNRSIKAGAYTWVEPRHLLAVATADDIPLFLDVMAACYARLSADALKDVRTIEEVVKRLGRARYRKDPGVTAKVEPLQAGAVSR